MNMRRALVRGNFRFYKLHCFQYRRLVFKFYSMSMDAAKKAAGYAAVDRHVKVNFSFDICKLIDICQSIKVAIY